jgi:hypothetical protein
MPDPWHAVIWTAYPLTVSRVVQHVKWVSARSLNEKRDISGPVWQKDPRHRSGAVATRLECGREAAALSKAVAAAMMNG